MSNKVIVNGVDVSELIERDTPKKPKPNKPMNKIKHSQRFIKQFTRVSNVWDNYVDNDYSNDQEAFEIDTQILLNELETAVLIRKKEIRRNKKWMT